MYVVQHRDELGVIWGPFPTADLAEEFAGFVHDEIDPCVVRRLRDPLGEALSAIRHHGREETRMIHGR